MMNSSNCTCIDKNCSNCFQEYLAPWAIILFDIIYVLIVIIGLIGNIMTCAATIMRKSMRRSIHLYVFNLAVCDTLILIFYVPNEMMRMGNHARYVWGSGMCVFTYTVTPIAINSTVFTLLAISLDRARGVLQPFEWRNGNRSHAKIIIPCIWIAAICIAIPVMIHAKLSPFNQGVVCLDEWPDPRNGLQYWYTLFAITYALPLVIIFALHIIMIHMLTREPILVEQKANKKMIKMTISIVIIFAICTGAQHFYFFMLQFHHDDMSKTTDGFLFFASNLVVSVQSACNPILYGTFRQDFNLAFRDFFLKLKLIFLSYNAWSCTKKKNPYEKVNTVSLAMVLRRPLPNNITRETSLQSSNNYRTPLLTQSAPKKTHYVVGIVPIEDQNNNESNGLCFTESNEPMHENDQKNTVIDAVDGEMNIKDNIPPQSTEVITPNVRSMMRSPTPNTSRSYSPYDNFDYSDNSDNSYEHPRPSSGITLQLKEISRLLNELQRKEILDDYAEKSRLSCEFLRLSETEKNDLFASYPSIDWLDFLQLLRNSRETDL